MYMSLGGSQSSLPPPLNKAVEREGGGGCGKAFFWKAAGANSQSV